MVDKGIACICGTFSYSLSVLIHTNKLFEMEKQNEIIKVQEETIKILKEHNEELTKILG